MVCPNSTIQKCTVNCCIANMPEPSLMPKIPDTHPPGLEVFFYELYESIFVLFVQEARAARVGVGIEVRAGNELRKRERDIVGVITSHSGL